jgi:ABC-type spermidine/putrescine transport systems, ATPase components
MSLYIDIEKSYGKFKLAIKLETGNETVALLGASGCGKSMTLRCIAGIERPDRGRIIIDGVTLFDSDRHINLSPQKRGAGLLFQNYALFPNMTVYNNIKAGIRNKKSNSQRVVDEAISRFRLDGLEHRLPSQLSGGQQQRVALARILVSCPNILMLDEPFSALDSHLRFQMETEVTEIIKNFGKTALFVSHNRDEVFRVCDRIAVLEDGHIDAYDEKHSLFDNPRTYSAAQLTGCKNISRAEKLGLHRLYAADWGVTLASSHGLPDGLCYAGIRAKRIVFGRTPENINSFKVEVIRVFEDVFSVIYIVRPSESAEPLRVEVSKSAAQPESGSPLFVTIAEEDILPLI